MQDFRAYNDEVASGGEQRWQQQQEEEEEPEEQWLGEVVVATVQPSFTATNR